MLSSSYAAQIVEEAVSKARQEEQGACFLSTRHVPRPAPKQLFPKLKGTMSHQEKMSQASTKLAWK